MYLHKTPSGCSLLMKSPGIFGTVVVFAPALRNKVGSFAPPHSAIGKRDRSGIKKDLFWEDRYEKEKSKNQVSELY